MSEIRQRAMNNERVLVTTLTKKMAEDLTDYLDEHGIRVRYLHSDIDTVERVEIIRDLRLGKFDALVGINLLREGLDMPEVSLVAILDADKEGFLRSTRSLIQTIGRAARHLHGKAILYADNISDSMKAAISETNRRRKKQHDYNIEHNITPKALNKKVVDIMMLGDAATDGTAGSQLLNGANEKLDVSSLTDAGEIVKLIEEMQVNMKKAAKELKFEEAMILRDRIRECNQRLKKLA